MLATVEERPDHQAAGGGAGAGAGQELVAEPEPGDRHAREAPRGHGVERLVNEPQLVLERRARQARVERVPDLVIHASKMRPRSKKKRASADTIPLKPASNPGAVGLRAVDLADAVADAGLGDDQVGKVAGRIRGGELPA